MKKDISNINAKSKIILFFCFGLFLQTVHAQTCTTDKDLAEVPGKYIDAAHCEMPQQKAHWLDQLGTPINKATANKVLTQIETLEKDSRKNFNLTGCVLKSAFRTPSNASIFYGKNSLLSYDLNVGCYEYFCYKNNLKVNDEYGNVLRAYVNRYPDIEYAFTFSDDYPFYETYNKYSGKMIALCNFIKQDEIHSVNNSKGYYQDIPESSVKFGNRSTFITRHWYFTKSNIQLLVPVTRKEYLEALLEYYDREYLYTSEKIKEIEKECAGMMKDPVKYPQLYENGKKNLTVRKARYPDYEKKIEQKKAMVQKALKENSSDWLSKPAVVKAKKENLSWKNYYGDSTNDYVTIDGYYADTPEDAEKTGTFTFSGFWDTKSGGTTLYKFNPEYFKDADKNPVKPYFIELAYRYINTKLGKDLVENFTENFDFDAVKNLIE